jgi:DNA-binding response OmpR family regulator
MKPRILLIEDSPEGQQFVSETLCDQGYTVSTLTDAERALATVGDWAQQYQLVIIEEAMQGQSGLKLLREARSKRGDLPVVMVTRDGNWSSYARALDAGASDYIPHPIDRRELVIAVEEALAQAT